MTSYDIKFSFAKDLDRLAEDFARVAGPPTYKTIQALERVLAASFADTEAKVHVITGSLKLSGKTESDYSAEDEWTGSISYGGESAGPNNPVDYAIYEQERGGEHDFFRDMPTFEDMYVDAIYKHFEALE